MAHNLCASPVYCIWEIARTHRGIGSARTHLNIYGVQMVYIFRATSRLRYLLSVIVVIDLPLKHHGKLTKCYAQPKSFNRVAFWC